MRVTLRPSYTAWMKAMDVAVSGMPTGRVARSRPPMLL